MEGNGNIFENNDPGSSKDKKVSRRKIGSNHGSVVKVCDYIEEVHMEKENPHFKMQDLAKMYEAFLKQLNDEK